MPSDILASIVFFAAAVRTEGTTLCPDPTAVAARLADILPASAAGGDHPDRGRFWEEGGDLVIVLERADGVLLGTRRLPRTHACEDLAAAVAVSLAAWESDVHPQFTPALATRRAVPAVVEPASAPSDMTESWSVEVGAGLGFGGSIDAPAGAADALIGTWLTPPSARTSVRAEVEGQSERQVALADGRASWRRWSLGLGVERPIFGSRLAATGNHVAGGRLSWFGLARLAWLNLHGEGFPQNHAVGVLDPGVTAGLRWARDDRGGRWSFDIELATSLWPVRHDAIEGATSDPGRLPAGELFLRLGATHSSAPRSAR